ncbi:MAG: ArgE/DapE family deacylase [Candidatus Lokiarchaeota archaeon]|nr:ArgE/DapE family deacylase [Candidatus Lokiarchaeota archaeon]
MVDEKRMIKLLRDLIQTNSESPPGREVDVANVLKQHMADFGIGCKSVGPSDRPNLIFFTHENTLGPLVIHGHMDTVPAGPLENWSHDPFAGKIVGNKLYGRGACDMKGPVTALVETMILYAQEKHETPLVMLATSDEESGCSGAEEVAASGILSGVKYGICAEPTSLDVLVGEKGMFWSKIVASGKSAHGSRPEEGINAIALAVKGLECITQKAFPYTTDELLGTPTLNVGMINGGIKINVVPDSCEIHLDMRIVKGQTTEDVMEQIRERFNDAGLSERVKIEYIHGKPAVSTPIDSPIVDASLAAVEKVTGSRPTPYAATYGTDCSVLQPKIGITNVICGPGSIEQAHQPDEFINLEQMYQSVDVYLEIASQILKP